MDKRHDRASRLRRGWFKLIYTLFLTAACAFVLLDTFVIPHTGVVVTKQTSQLTAAENVSAQSGSESETASSGGTDSSTDSSGTYTDTSYTDSNMSISYKTERVNDTTVYVVDVQLSDASQLKTAFAENTYGRNIKETTSDMAEDNGAVLAINGDYYGFRNAGYVLRNGTLYRDTSNSGEDLVVESDGTFKIIEEDDTSAGELQSEGALQVFSFGPALINNGEICVDENTEVEQAKTSNPRTAIGMISPLHYIIVVSDGRTDESAGLSLYELAQVFADENCTVAYNLDGGGSTTLYFNGKVINTTTGGTGNSERKVSDIIYF